MRKLQGYSGGEINVSFKLQKEEPENKLMWQAAQVTGKNNMVLTQKLSNIETKNLA